MKIKLHNSLSKVDDYLSLRFLFDEKIFLHLPNDVICLYYQIDDLLCFLMFSPKTKEFEEWNGFGRNEKHFNPGWWKDPFWNWQ